MLKKKKYNASETLFKKVSRAYIFVVACFARTVHVVRYFESIVFALPILVDDDICGRQTQRLTFEKKI